jgi:hypothetical protein
LGAVGRFMRLADFVVADASEARLASFCPKMSSVYLSAPQEAGLDKFFRRRIQSS